MDLKERGKHFGEVFDEEYLWMHRKLSIGLISVKREKEALIDDLIQEIAYKAWLNYINPKYADKSVVELLRMKTDNVLKDYFKKKKLVPLDQAVFNLAVPSFQNAFEAQDMINFLQNNPDIIINLFVCKLKDEGYSYHEIWSRLKLSPSFKMNICRFRKKLRNSWLKPF